MVGLTIMQLGKEMFRIRNLPNISHLSLRFTCSEIADDAVVSVLESILYGFFLGDASRTVFLKFERIKPGDISGRYLAQSIVLRLGDALEANIYGERFIKDFEKAKDFKGLLSARWTFLHNEETTKYVELYDDVPNFLKHALASKAIKDQEAIISEISEAIAEVAYNVRDHSDGDLIVQCKYMGNLVMRPKFDSKRVGVLCCSLLNVGEKTIGGTIKEALDSGLSDKGKEMVRKTLKVHEPFFNEIYTEDEFYYVSSFQKGVTRKDVKDSDSYGTGLTVLIKSLKNRVYLSYCYGMSGRSVSFFQDKYLGFGEAETIGFNESGSYLQEPPSPYAIAHLPFFFPGSIFNLVFVVEVLDE